MGSEKRITLERNGTQMEHETEHQTEHATTAPVVAAVVPDARVTLTDAARMTGASRNRLYRAIVAGRIARSEDGLLSVQELVAAGFEFKEPLPSTAKPADHLSFLLTQYTEVAAQLRESLEDQNDDLRERMRTLEEQLQRSQQREAQLLQLLPPEQAVPAVSAHRSHDAPRSEPQDAAADMPQATHRVPFADQAAEAPLPADAIPSGEHQEWLEVQPHGTQAGGFLRRWKS
jgi:hypothetical protein